MKIYVVSNRHRAELLEVEVEEKEKTHRVTDREKTRVIIGGDYFYAGSIYSKYDRNVYESKILAVAFLRQLILDKIVNLKEEQEKAEEELARLVAAA